MATTNMKKRKMNTERYRDLKQMLEGPQAGNPGQLQERIRDVRTENASGKMSNVLDPVESSEAGIQEDIEFALIQMKAETLQQGRRGARPARRGGLRQLLRVRRGDRASSVCARSRSRSAAATARRPARAAQRRERMAAQRQSSSALFFDMSS